jgi:hypothetical protein
VKLELAVSRAMACPTAVSVPVISAFVVDGVSAFVFDASADDIAIVVVLVAVVVAVEDAVDSGPIVDNSSAVALADFAIDPIAVAVAVAVAAPDGPDPSIAVTVAIAVAPPLLNLPILPQLVLIGLLLLLGYFHLLMSLFRAFCLSFFSFPML